MTNSVSLCAIGSGSECIYDFTLLNPSTGSQSYVITRSGGTYTYAYGASYTGVGGLDGTGTGTGATSATVSITTTKDNDWLVGNSRGFNGALTAGANTSIWDSTEANNWIALDTNGAQTPVGSHSMNVTSASTNLGIVAVALSPSITTPTTYDIITSWITWIF